MKPTGFKYANRELQPPEGATYSENIASIDPLPIWTDGEQCVSCWKMTVRERLAALLFGRVWLSVLSGSTQPPVYAEASRVYLEEVRPRERCYLRGLTLLGIFNTACGCLFGQVLVKVTDTDTGKTVRWYWDAAVKHPPEAA